MRFHDRVDAGRQLASRLERMIREHPVVVALPRGGVPVAFEVARALGAPLDIAVVQKVGAPWQPEVAVGAVGEGGVHVVNRDVAESFRLSSRELAPLLRAGAQEVDAQLARLRTGRPPVVLAGRTVILVDDGLATGATARAASLVLRARGARRIVLAVPVAPSGAVEAVTRDFDQVVALQEPEQFLSVGQWY